MRACVRACVRAYVRECVLDVGMGAALVETKGRKLVGRCMCVSQPLRLPTAACLSEVNDADKVSDCSVIHSPYDTTKAER